jgi:hypothetical protein
MGDKGKKDKDKARKQKIKKQAQTAKPSPEKLPIKISCIETVGVVRVP